MDKVIHSYSLEEAVEDGLLSLVGRVGSRSVVVTIGIRTELPVEEWWQVVERFLIWQRQVELTLPEAERLFTYRASNGQTIWVIDDGDAITMMYPDEY